jgi:hypothetical protein
MVIDSELLKKNCLEYSKSHHKAIIVLRTLNGKTDYKSISQKLNLPATTVSYLQKKAQTLGLAQKQKNGLYKKTTGILEYFTSAKKDQKTITSQKTIPSRLKKIRMQRTEQKKLSSSVISAHEKMLHAYSRLYITENLLRELIRAVFKEQKNWWNTDVVPKGVKNSVQDTQQKAPYHAAKRRDELEYAHIGQLKEIIVHNWKEFLPYLNEQNKEAFQVIIDRAIPSRNAIGHCIPLESEDLKIIEVRLNDIQRMIKDY